MDHDQGVSGPPLTGASAEAAAHLGRAIASVNHWRVDAMDHLEAALQLDGDWPLAHAVKGLALAGARNRRFQPLVEQSLVAAQAGASGVSAHERGYIQALEAVAGGRLLEAVAAYETILAEHPTDLLAHRLVQQELFWMGEAERMRAVVERAAPAWSAAQADHSLFLSIRAFSCEEALDYAAAEGFGRAAIELDPTDAWGAHAVAHVLLMQGRNDDGVAWLEPLTGNWAGKNQIVHHLWWHLCLFLLERGEHERILALYDREVRNPDSPLVRAMPDAYIDLQNAAALLLRLELVGVEVGDRWTLLADVAEGRIDDSLSPFTSAHAAAILAANGRFELAAELIGSMAAFAASGLGPLQDAMRLAAIPAAEASVAHRKGDHAAVVAGLLPARHELHRMGGSHAQRDVFFQLLADSCRRLGRVDDLADLLRDIAEIGFHAVPLRRAYAEAAGLVH